MSWLFSQVLVAEYLAGTCLDGEPSAQSSGDPTQQAYCAPDKMTAFSRLSRFGMTYKPLTADRGAALLTSYLADSRAKTSAQPAKVPALTANAPAYGDKWRELSVRYDPDSSSWRTHRSLWDEDLSACSLTLLKWGSMRGGVLSELLTLERRTAENDAGFWPTPNVPNDGRSCAHVTEWSESGKTAYHNGKKVQVGLEHAVRHWTTPCADDTGHRTAKYAQGGTALSMQAGGSLNPTWVEWLMGWPLGWTDLKPLAMDKFREWQQEHSLRLQDNKEAACPSYS